MIFFLTYSLTTRFLRINAMRITMPLAVEHFTSTGHDKSDAEIADFEDKHWWARVGMASTATLTFTMILGVRKYRAFFYIIPWVVLLDKVFEYPITGTVLAPYECIALAFFSQSSLFQIVLFSCQNLIETIIIFWILQIRGVTWL